MKHKTLSRLILVHGLILGLAILLISPQTAVADENELFIDSGQSLGSSKNTRVALGDVDNDGYLDAFVVKRHGPNHVWLNDGNAVFTDSGQSLGNWDSLNIALEDIDGDGDLDALVANIGDDGFNPANRVWLNNGAGTFIDSGQTLGNSWSYGLATGDLDNDGDADAFVANNRYYGGGIANRVWFNDGTGTFTDSGQRLGYSYSTNVALGDIDHDGDLDAFVVNARFNQPDKVWLNDGTGFFIDSGQSLGSSFGYSVRLGDLDNDGDLDAFVANSHDQPNKIWLNNGTGTFTTNGQDLGNSQSTDTVLGDLDGDCDLDAFVANSNYLPNKVWLNDGTGFFIDSGQNLGSSYSYGVDIGDLDGDGDLDAFVAINQNQGNKVWLNTSSTVISGTIDIVPDTLNLKSKGKWITSHVELPDGRDAADINMETVTLEDTIPAETHPTGIGDYDSDGIPDRMIKFHRETLIRYLEGTTGNVTLTVSGELTDGTLFEGNDTITVIKPGKSRK